ncbi:hypothetical protein HON86_03160 [Candidatus Woesearchaeota archaeon]|jgi:hypothetical protein|nr:hypothetical protein [Candidatus Woesearchaeota archaeon]MBT4835587.1 hypothetical protein [Candidatus Woesearchaeota archaeon]MBT6734923.1 hypothetical protein [Candidatus Woesearchaeota archaeon]MBT7169780.1 hypothetical protein [Candidatus Woesearchaeota archaeon]MBT7474444.1 hypothetical protein [Candidatus Woesearchaeota archaeon]
MEYTEPKIILETRPGYDPNQYVMPFENMDQCVIKFSKKNLDPYWLKNLGLEEKIKDENPS